MFLKLDRLTQSFSAPYGEIRPNSQPAVLLLFKEGCVPGGLSSPCSVSLPGAVGPCWALPPRYAVPAGPPLQHLNIWESTHRRWDSPPTTRQSNVTPATPWVPCWPGWADWQTPHLLVLPCLLSRAHWLFGMGGSKSRPTKALEAPQPGTRDFLRNDCGHQSLVQVVI